MQILNIIIVKLKKKSRIKENLYHNYIGMIYFWFLLKLLIQPELAESDTIILIIGQDLTMAFCI